MRTIFPQISLNRDEIHWEDYLEVLTPVEKVGKLWFKRGDYFAPLGYGFINGDKVKVGIHIFNEYIKDKHDAILGGMSLHSPQHSFQAVAAKHYNIPSYHIIGSTTPESALRHENIEIAARFGAKFKIINIAYNPAIQKAVQDEMKLRFQNAYPLGYAISLDHHKEPAAEIEKFHRIASHQAENIPDHIENIVIPAGSCNSTTGILYGLALHRPKNLRNVYLIGIGPQKINYFEERLDIIEKVTKKDIKIYKRNFVDHPELSNSILDFFQDDDGKYNLHYHDLQKRKIYEYADTETCNYEGIELHPRYEAKVFKWMYENLNAALMNDKTLFWIIGSAPRMSALMNNEALVKQLTQPEFKTWV